MNIDGEDIGEEIDEMNEIEEEGRYDIIVRIFKSIDYEYTVLDIIQELKKDGYKDAGEMILGAIEDNLLYVSSVENDGTIYLALTEEGEEIWSLYE